jgi:hypothetical protein
MRDQELLRKEIGAASREEYKQQHSVAYMQAICHQLWDQPQINWDQKTVLTVPCIAKNLPLSIVV